MIYTDEMFMVGAGVIGGTIIVLMFVLFYIVNYALLLIISKLRKKIKELKNE